MLSRLGIACLLWLALMTAGCTTQAYEPYAPQVSNGVVNLDGWEPDLHGPLDLSGPWALYWHQLLSPDELEAQAAPPDSHTSLPHTWNDIPSQDSDFSTNTHAGYATYQLTLENLPKTSLILFSQPQGLAARWYSKANGTQTLLQDQGVVGTSRESYVPWESRLFSILPASEDGRVSVVLQIANFDHQRGGAWYAPRLGTSRQMYRESGEELQRSFVLIGICFIMALYHLGLYVQRRRDQGSLIFAFVCLIVSIRECCVVRLMEQLVELPDATLTSLRFIAEYETMYVGVPILFMFFQNLFPKSFGPTLLKGVIVFFGIWALRPLLLPLESYSKYLIEFQAIVMVFNLYVFSVLLRLAVQGNEIAREMALGLTFILLCLTHDILVSRGVLNNPFILTYGVVGLILVQSYILSKRFSQAFETNQVLTKELARKSKDLELELTARRSLEGEISHMEERLEIAQGELTQAERLLVQAQKLATLGELVASIGHELNNPIGSLKLSLASGHDTVAETREFFNSIFEDVDDAQQAKQMAADLQTRLEQDNEVQLLCAERIQEVSEALRKASRVDNEAIPFDLNDIVSNSITLTQGKLKRFKIHTELGPLEEVMCHPSHLGQVFTNILSNAADALDENPEQSGTIQIRTQPETRSTIDGVSVVIEDSGSGIPEDLKDKILQPFFTTKAAGVGTGLGLPICARIIAAHEGKLEIAQSSELGGARFEVWVPKAPMSLN